MIDQKFAHEFAEECVRSWKAHDLDAVLSHYSDDFEMTSPFISSVTGGSSNTLNGKDAVGEYWSVALSKFTDLRFEISDVLVSQDSLVIYYRSALSGGHRMAAELFIFDDQGLVTKSIAHYDEF